jgi:hypothetical protein
MTRAIAVISLIRYFISVRKLVIMQMGRTLNNNRIQILGFWTESELLYDLRFTANRFVLATSPLRLTTYNFIFQLNTDCYSPYATSSLMREWVCHLQLLLILASAVILRPESRGTHDVLLSQFRDSPTWRARSPYLYPPGIGWPGYTPRHWVPFSSQVFDPASTRFVLDIIYRPMFYLKLNVSETGFCLRLQVEPTQLRPIDRASPADSFIDWAKLSFT